MMFGLLAATLLAATLTAPPPVDPRVAAFGDACLAATPATREALASLAAQRGWAAVRPGAPDGVEWRDVYRADDFTVRLDQSHATGEDEGARICVVLVGQAPAGWSDQVSTLLVDGDPVGSPDAYESELYQLPPGLELTVWDLPNGSRIHALRTSDGLLELSVNYPVGRVTPGFQAVSRDPVADFARLCVQPRADAVEVARLVEAEAGWSSRDPVEAGIQTWSRYRGDVLWTLAYGFIQTDYGPKRFCNLTWSPGDPDFAVRLPEGLAPATGTADAEAGIYIVAESGDAVDARRFDIVALSQDDESTSLTLFRTER